MQSPIPISVDVPRSSFVGVFNDSYYAFMASADGTYAITLANPSTDVSWTLYSNNTFTSYVDSCDDHWSADTESCTVDLTAGAYYYLRVTNWDLSAATYVLTVHHIGSEGTAASPVNLTVGASHAGTVGKAGVSYYKFTPSASTSHSVAITNIVPNYYPLTVKILSTPSDSATPNLLQTCTSTYNPVCTANGLTAGVPYYVEVHAGPGSAATYTIAVTAGVSQGSVANPVDIAVGAANPHPGAVDASGSSYYRFITLDASGEYFLHLNGATTLTAEVYSGSNFSTGFLKYCSLGPTPCRLDGLNGRTYYYVKVPNYTSVAVEYQIAVSRGVTEGSTGQPIELTLGTPHTATAAAAAAAYYSFQTGTFAGSYTVSLTGTQKDMGWTLHSAFGSYPLTTCNTSATDGVNEICVTANLKSNTTYYLQVANNDGAIESAYVVQVDAGGGSEGAVNDPKPLGPIAAAGGTFPGTVRAAGDSYYSFTTGNAAAYVISLRDMSSNLGWHLYASSAYGTSFMSCEFSTMSTSVICSTNDGYVSPILTAATTYYLRVHNLAATTSTFNLTLDPLDPAEGCNATATECLDFEAGIPAGLTQNSTFAKGNQWKWVIDSTASAGPGSKNLRSGTLNYNEDACFTYTPAVRPTSVKFSYWAEVEGLDLSIWEAGVTVKNVSQLSSVGAWKRYRYAVPTGSASVAFEWCWDRSSTAGTPLIRIDDIEFE